MRFPNLLHVREHAILPRLVFLESHWGVLLLGMIACAILPRLVLHWGVLLLGAIAYAILPRLVFLELHWRVRVPGPASPSTGRREAF